MAATVLISLASVRAGTLIVHNAHHFQIEAPDGWSAAQDVDVGGSTADLVMRGAPPDPAGPVGGFIVVASERRSIGGGLAEAARILQEGIDNLSASAMGFRILESPTTLTLNGQSAAKVVFWTQPSTYEVYQILYVVTSPGWNRFWALSGGMFIWDVPTIGPKVNASLATFTVSAGPLGSDFGSLAALSTWLLAGGLMATAIESGVIVYLAARRARRTP